VLRRATIADARQPAAATPLAIARRAIGDYAMPRQFDSAARCRHFSAPPLYFAELMAPRRRQHAELFASAAVRQREPLAISRSRFRQLFDAEIRRRLPPAEISPPCHSRRRRQRAAASDGFSSALFSFASEAFRRSLFSASIFFSFRRLGCWPFSIIYAITLG